MKNIIILFVLFQVFALRAFAVTDPPFDIQHAMTIIQSTYGDEVKLKPKTLLKFGESNQVSNTTFTTLMGLPAGTLNETYVSTNVIDKISSSSGSDTGTVVLEGHQCDASGNKTFVVQTVTLAGQTETALEKALCRATRLYNTSSSNFVGDIYVYQDDTVSSGVPQTAAKVHLIVHAANDANQSFKASTTLSSKDYYIITNAFSSINEKTGSPIAEVRIEVRPNGGVFRVAGITSISTPGTTSGGFRFDPPIIVPKNADVRMRAKASANGVVVSGWLNGYLATIKD